MSKAILNVPDISCGHCEAAITKALQDRPGIDAIRVDIPAKQVYLDYEDNQISLDQVKEILEEEDYPVSEVTPQ